jgi:hypothetical protein
MYCNNCGEKLLENDKYCSNCGVPSAGLHIMEKNNYYILGRMDKAQGLAAWSFSGILIPFLGLILAGYSQSILNSIDKNKLNITNLNRYNQIMSTGTISFFFSIVSFVIWVILIFNNSNSQ